MFNGSSRMITVIAGTLMILILLMSLFRGVQKPDETHSSADGIMGSTETSVVSLPQTEKPAYVYLSELPAKCDEYANLFAYSPDEAMDWHKTPYPYELDIFGGEKGTGFPGTMGNDWQGADAIFFITNVKDNGYTKVTFTVANEGRFPPFSSKLTHATKMWFYIRNDQGTVLYDGELDPLYADDTETHQITFNLADTVDHFTVTVLCEIENTTYVMPIVMSEWVMN